MGDSRVNTIIDFFAQMHPPVKVTKELLETGKQEDILHLYYAVCDMLFDFAGLPEIRNDDPFARAKITVRIFDCVTGLLTDLNGTSEFRVSDLVTPIGNHNKLYLSELIEFYYFKCDRKKELNEVDQEIENRRRQVEDEKVFERNAVELLEKARAAQEEAHRKKIEAMHKATEAQKRVVALTERKREMKRTFEAKQALETELNERIAQLGQSIADAEEKGKRLDLNIVSSPNRIVSDIEGMKREAAEMEEKQARVDQEVRGYERVIANHGAAKRIVDNLHGELKHLELYKEKLDESRRVRDESQQRLKEVEMKSRTMELSIRELHAKSEADIRKLNDKAQQDVRHMELAQQETQHLVKDQDDLKVRRNKAKEELRAGQQSLKEREKAVNELYANYDRSVQLLLDGEKRVEDAVRRETIIVERTLQVAMGTFRLSSGMK